jgi:predicted RNase H-like HicB family nuclease
MLGRHLTLYSLFADPKKRALPVQGTCFWALMQVWEGGIHDFTVPAVPNVTGGGTDYNAALKDVQEKLAVMVVDEFEAGAPVRVLDRGQAMYKLRGRLAIIAEECQKLGRPMPKVKKSKMVQVSLDYGLVHKYLQKSACGPQLHVHQENADRPIL